jgi:hypothetical protein
MTAHVVELDACTLAAHGLSRRDLWHAPAGAVIVLPDGSAWRVTEHGALDPVRPFGFRSIASDPSARRASR